MRTDLFRYATAATPGAVHEQNALRAIARMIKTPFMPWQDHVARVATEHHPEVRNQYRYPIVVVTVPRQAGKSQEFTVVQLERSARRRRHLTYTTAQTGLSARDLWRTGVLAVVDPPTADELGTEVNRLLAKRVRKVSNGAGDPGVRFTNGSFIAPYAPGPKALDGKRKVGLLGVDEAFAFDDAGGSALMGSIGPTQTVAEWRQLWIFSTKGGRRSTWFNEWLRKGRIAVDDPDSDIAFFESSAEPGCDPEDPASLAFHPAIGHTTTLASLWADRSKYSLVEWKRGYLNLDAEDDATAYELDPDQLDKLASIDTMPELPDVAIGVDLAVDRSAASIVAAWPDTSQPNAVHVRVLVSHPGIGWVPGALDDLRRQGARFMWADATGPTRSLIDDLKALDDPIYLSVPTARDYGSACQWTLDAVAAGRLHHDGSPTLVDQARSLVTRPLGGVKAFDADRSEGPIDVLRALALAAHHAATRPLTIQVF